MAWVDYYLISQRQQLLVNALQKKCVITARQVCPAYTAPKQDISRETNVSLLIVECNMSR